MLLVAHLPITLLPPIAGNESCPQPQTSEHLAAIEIMKLKHILILQNKIDLVKESQAKEQYEQILAFVQGEGCGRGVRAVIQQRFHIHVNIKGKKMNLIK